MIEELLESHRGRLLAFLRLSISRPLARESSSFDRYWNGAIDVAVPLRPAPNAR